MAQRHSVAEARLLQKWICMKCSATHRGTKPRACRKPRKPTKRRKPRKLKNPRNEDRTCVYPLWDF